MLTIPKVNFKLAPLEEDIRIINHFLNPTNNWDWSYRIYRNYPDLEKKLKEISNYEKRMKITQDFFEQFFKNKKNKIMNETKRFQKEWDVINDDVMNVLSEIIEIDWPDEYKKFSARVSLNPICPRYIKEKNFDIFHRLPIDFMKCVCIHEISHFIYFEKWKEVFPNVKEEEFDSPHLVWHLSEMVPAIILNDKRIQDVFEYEFRSYTEYENFEINKKPILNYLRDFYDDKKDFEDFLKKSWNFVSKYEKEIKSI